MFREYCALCCVTSDGRVENLDLVKSADEFIVVLVKGSSHLGKRQFLLCELKPCSFALLPNFVLLIVFTVDVKCSAGLVSSVLLL